MTTTMQRPVLPRWSAWRARQRAAGDWVVEQTDRHTQRAQRWTMDGDGLTEPLAREIAANLNGNGGHQ